VFYFLVRRTSVSNEKMNAMNKRRRYPKNSNVTPVIKKPIRMMMTAAQIPAIIRCLLSI
jgi:hypothetical protein